jgi:hypothetical protein
MRLVLATMTQVLAIAQPWKFFPTRSSRTRVVMTDTRRATTSTVGIEWKRRTVIKTTTRRL